MNAFTFTKDQFPSLEAAEIINLDKVDALYCTKGNDSYPYCIKLVGIDSNIYFKDGKERDTAFRILMDFINKTKNMNNTVSTVTSDVKSFIKEHRQVIYWVLIALLVDHFVMEGKLTDKIRNMIHGILERAEQAITGKKPATPEDNIIQLPRP